MNLTGRPGLIDAEGRAIRLPGKAFVLAAHLMLEPARSPLSRERAARFLWEEADQPRRAGNLRQLLARIREIGNETGLELFRFGGDGIALDPDAAQIDLRTILAARANPGERQLLELGKAWNGDLLHGHDEGGEEFTRWLWASRSMVRDQFVAVVAANLEQAIGVLESEEIVLLARRLIEADRYQEVGHRALMRVHAARGEFDTALRINRRLTEQLREIGTRPSSETAALFAEIVARSRSGVASTAAEVAPAAAAEDRTPVAAPAVAGGQLPRVAMILPRYADLQPGEREWVDVLLDDVAIQLWRTRSFVLTRTGEPSAPINLLDRSRREQADYVIDFRVAARAGGRCLTASLLCRQTGEILWIYRFDFGEPSARAVRELVTNCVHQIEQTELRILATAPERATAYRLTVQGNRLLRSIDLRSIRRARQIFRSALAIDVEHAPTLAALSKAYRLEWLLLARADDKELDLAIDFARQSIAASPDAAHGLHQLGICSIYKKRHEFGLEALGRSERYIPFEDELIADHADALIISGLADAGLAKIGPLVEDRAIPSDQVLWIAASGQFLAGHYREALATLSRLSSQEPAYQLEAACHALLDESEEARRYARKLREVLPDFKVSMRLGMVPLRRREDIERYEHGLRSAGLD